MTLTVDRKTEILGLWNDGLSATLVAQRLSTSRNAVIGVMHRAAAKGESVRSAKDASPSNRGTRPQVARQKPSAPTLLTGKILPAVRLSKTVYAPGKPIPFLALRDSLCKFAVSGAGGHLGPFKFCGQPVRPGVSYCEHHCEIAFDGLARKSLRTLPRDRHQQYSVGR